MGNQALADNCSDLNEANSNMTTIEKRCYDNVLWAKETGCRQDPEWYAVEGIHSCGNGSILDFQCALWQMKGPVNQGVAHNCSKPCGSPLCPPGVKRRESNPAANRAKEASFPTWAVVLSSLAVLFVCGALLFLYYGKGDGKAKKEEKEGSQITDRRRWSG